MTSEGNRIQCKVWNPGGLVRSIASDKLHELSVLRQTKSLKNMLVNAEFSD